MLSYDPSVPLAIRAQLANVSGDPLIFSEEPSKFGSPVSMAAFRIEVVRKQMNVWKFLSDRPPHDYSRPANRGEYIAFIGWHPDIARTGRLVCLNTKLFLGEGAAARVIFRARGDHFEGTLIRDEDILLEPGDRVIFMN